MELILEHNKQRFEVPVNIHKDKVLEFIASVENKTASGELTDEQKAFEKQLQNALFELQNEYYYHFKFGRYGNS